MIKEKLKKALADAVDAYNSGTGVNAAIAKTAAAYDFNQDQTDRLCELFNTAAALRQEKDASNPTGTCELASKEAVAKLLLSDDEQVKVASAESGGQDLEKYAFYSSSPERHNTIIDARENGVDAMVKAASSVADPIPPELNVSQRCIYDMISNRIELLKSAGATADEITRQLQLEADRLAVKIAKTIEHPFADPELADMFKAACDCAKAVEVVSEYSTKVAESTGGRFAKANVFDTSKVEDLVKMANEMGSYLDQIQKYENEREKYFAKAAEAEGEVCKILGISGQEKKASMADFFVQGSVVKVAGNEKPVTSPDPERKQELSKIAELLRKTGVKSDDIEKIAQDLEKDASPTTLQPRLNFSASDIFGALSGKTILPGMTQKILNEYRRMLLDDLLSNDPIIRDADPNTVAEIYKSIVMSAPRLSLDPTVVRSVLRSGVNSVAISPNDIKTLTDVDKGVALANVERLTALDSSIKDSNMA